MENSVRYFGASVIRFDRPLRKLEIRRAVWSVGAVTFALISPVLAAFGQESSPPEAQSRSQTSDASTTGVLEEIVVTAQRRQDRLIYEPTSISTVDGEFLRQQHITDFQDLGNYVPNVRFDVGGGGQATSTAGIRPNIRGFSTPPRIQTMESPVGLAVNDVAYNRSEYFETAFLDVDRVEVLRGPQGTLFGKNTSIGLLSVTTKRPTDVFTGFFDIEGGEFDRRRAEAAVGGPLVPGAVNFRIAGLADSRDGFMTNTTAEVDPTASSKQGSYDRWGVRAQLQFLDVFGGDLLIGYERFDIRGQGLATELRSVGENQAILFRQFDENADFEPGNNINSIPGNFSRQVVIDNFRANLNYNLTGGWGLQGVVGWSTLDASRGGDIQPQPAGGWNSVFTEDTTTLTVEALATSPEFPGFFGLGAKSSSSFSGGVFYQRTRDDPIASELSFSQAHILNLLGAQAAPPAPVPPGSREPYHPAPGEPGIETIERFVDETGESVGILGQLHWSPADRWTITGGFRLSWEDKDSDLVQIVSPDPAIFSELTGTSDFEASFTRSERHFTPRVAVTYDWSDDIRFYASRTEGYRAGGFSSLLSNADAAGFLEFQPEEITSWEIGTRGFLSDQNLSFNLGLFHMELTDYQLSTNVPVGVFNPPAVINVGEVEARGIEADIGWSPARWLTIVGALGFNDTELVDFPFGPCAPDRPNTDGDADPRCDLSGKPLPQAPEWTVSVSPRVTVPVKGFEWFGGLGVQWTDSQVLDETLDPRSREPSFFWLDADIGISNPEQGWTITLAAQNLTDESVATIVEHIGLTSDTFVQSVRPPRQVFLGLHWEF